MLQFGPVRSVLFPCWAPSEQVCFVPAFCSAYSPERQIHNAETDFALANIRTVMRSTISAALLTTVSLESATCPMTLRAKVIPGGYKSHGGGPRSSFLQRKSSAMNSEIDSFPPPCPITSRHDVIPPGYNGTHQAASSPPLLVERAASRTQAL